MYILKNLLDLGKHRVDSYVYDSSLAVLAYKMDKKARKDQNRTLDSLQLLYDEEVSARSMKLSLYEVLFQVFQSNQVGGKNLKYKKIRFILSNLFESFQLVGVLLGKQDIESWERYNFVWDIFQYARLDHLASELGVLLQVSLVIEISLIVQVALFLSLVLAVYNKKPPPHFAFSMLKVSFMVVVFCFRVPTQILVQSLIFFQISKIYKEGWGENIPFAFLAMVSFVFFFVVCTIGQSQIRHHKENIVSKSSCQLEMSAFAIRFVGISFFVYNGSSDMIYLCAIAIIGECCLLRQCVVYQYYYDHSANQVKALSFSLVLSSGIAVLVGNIVNSAGACLLILALMSPSMSTWILWWMPNKTERRPSVRKIKQLIESPQDFPAFTDVEEVLRPVFLFNLTEEKELVLNALSAYFTNSLKNRYSHLVVWEANYCLETLKNERLARIKLTRRLVSNFSLEGDYQAFVLLQHICHEGSEYFQDLDFLQFRRKLDEVRDTDTSLCENFLELMEELTDSEPKAPLLHKLIKNISISVKRVEYVYDILCTSYRTNKEVFDLYQSFLADIMKNECKSKLITEKFGEFLEEEPRHLKYFDSSNAIMIVSGNFHNLGIISYANDLLIHLLQEPDLVGKHLEELIPPPFSSGHKELLKRYLFSCTNTKIRLHKSLFLVTSKGYMIEMYIKVKCIALDTDPVFLVILKPKNKDRELVILDEDGFITCHTQNVSKILELNFFLVNGLNFEEYILEHGVCEYRHNSSFYVLNGHKVYYNEKKVYSTTIKIYEFHPYESIIEKRKKTSSNAILKRMRNTIMTHKNKSDKRIQIIAGPNICPVSDSQERVPIQISKSLESEKDRRKIASLVELPGRAIKLLAICLTGLNLIIALLAVSQGIYILNGLDPKVLFNSVKTIVDMEYYYLKIANEARMLDLIDYQDSFSQNVIPFRDFMSYNKCMIDMLASQGLEDKIYDQNLGYWDGTELKYTTLVDFSAKVNANGIDYFENGENVESYKFIIKNSKSIPQDYLKSVMESVKVAIESTRENYAFITNTMVTVSCVLIVLVLTISIILTLKLRNWTMKYWELFHKYISENYLNIQKVFLDRLELVHKYKDVTEMYKPFKMSKWTEPKIPMSKYLWRSIALGILIFSYYSFFSYYHAIELKSLINRRLELTITLGESTVKMQTLNFWTREMIYKNSLNLLLSDLNPLKDAESCFIETHTKTDELFKKFLKKEEVQFNYQENNIFFDKTNYETGYFFAGIYGSVKVLLLDSKYYSFADGDKDSMYREFVDELVKTDAYLRYLLKTSVDNSVNLINEKRNRMVISNFLFFSFVLFVSLGIFAPFIREEKQMIQHKHNIIEIVRFRDNYTR